LSTGRETLGTSVSERSEITSGSTGLIATAGPGFGSGSATIVGCSWILSGETFSCFGFRGGITVPVKWSGKLYDSLGIRDMAGYWWETMLSDFAFSRQSITSAR
jgi:hypothetical protein